MRGCGSSSSSSPHCCFAPAVASGAGETSIFYYPWWGTPQRDGKYLHWNKGDRLPPKDLASSFYPSRGPYSSRDWKVLSQHMSEIARAGVDEVVSSWWGLGSPEADRLPTVMRAAWKHGLDVAVHLEPYEKWLRTRAIVEADFEYLRGARSRPRLRLLSVRQPDRRQRVAGALGAVPDRALRADERRRACRRGRLRRRLYVRRVRRPRRRLRGLLRTGKEGRYRLRAVSRAGLQRESGDP